MRKKIPRMVKCNAMTDEVMGGLTGVPILCTLKTSGEMVDGWHAVNATWDEAGDRGETERCGKKQEQNETAHVTCKTTCALSPKAISTSSVERIDIKSPSSSSYLTRRGPSSRRGPQRRIFLPTRSTRSPYCVVRETWMTKMSEPKCTFTFTGSSCDDIDDRLTAPDKEESLEPNGVRGEELLGEYAESSPVD